MADGARMVVGGHSHVLHTGATMVVQVCLYQVATLGVMHRLVEWEQHVLGVVREYHRVELALCRELMEPCEAGDVGGHGRKLKDVADDVVEPLEFVVTRNGAVHVLEPDKNGRPSSSG
jgi:hypothetical protein